MKTCEIEKLIEESDSQVSDVIKKYQSELSGRELDVLSLSNIDDINLRVLTYANILIRGLLKSNIRIECAYLVGSVAKLKAKQQKYRRRSFEYLDTDGGFVLKCMKTELKYTDMDLEIILEDVNQSKKYLSGVIKEIDLPEIPVDIRLVGKKDADWYLQTESSKPNYLVFRLLFGNPLIIYSDNSAFEKYRQKAKIFAKKYSNANEFLEYKMYKAFEIEVKHLKSYLFEFDDDIIYLNETKLRELHPDLLWLLKMRVSKVEGEDTFVFPRKNGYSAKLKENYQG